MKAFILAPLQTVYWSQNRVGHDGEVSSAVTDEPRPDNGELFNPHELLSFKLVPHTVQKQFHKTIFCPALVSLNIIIIAHKRLSYCISTLACMTITRITCVRKYRENTKSVQRVTQVYDSSSFT